MSKNIPIATIIRQHSRALRAMHQASEAIEALRRNVLATFVTVPEFGATHIFSDADLAAAAQRHEKERNWPKDSPELTAFRERIAAYRKTLAELLALKQQWREHSGLEGWEQARWDAIFQGRKASKELLRRLRADRDTAAIVRHLGRFGAQIAPDQLQATLRIIGRARGK
jgi:hypothetical protein